MYGGADSYTGPAFLWALGVLVVTTVHHVYGAELYQTPERYHAVVIAAAALMLMVVGVEARRRWPDCWAGRLGWWLFWTVAAVIPVLLFGLVEGLYNHVIKVSLWALGLPEASLRRLFPEPAFELPNDFLFEVTGVLHVVPAFLAGYHLARMLRDRVARQTHPRAEEGGAVNGHSGAEREPIADTGWVDRAAYPFTPRSFEVDGAHMHYVDEGDGPPVLLVHGTTTWSFLYRDLIRTLSRTYRCIAPDHLGYGLSDKPEDVAYRPRDHARRLKALVEHLGLRDVALIVHDFGGPIGLAYALEQPRNIRALVLFNTWMWTLRGEPLIEMASRIGGGSVGRLFFRRFNIELRTVFKTAWGDRSKLSAALHRQYTGPFPRPSDREPMWILARELLGSSDWYEELWSRRERISHIPALLLWGLKDPILRARHLSRWQELFRDAQTVTFPTAGHFVPEEARDELRPVLERFLDARRTEGGTDGVLHEFGAPQVSANTARNSRGR